MTGTPAMMHAEPVPATTTSLPTPDLARMRRERLERLRGQMALQGVDAAVLLHGRHVTYATGHVPEAIDASHLNHRRSLAIVPAEGPVRLHPHGDGDGLECDVGRPLWPELDEDMDALGDALHETVGDVSGRRVAVDAVTGAMTRAGLLDGADLVDAGTVLGPARLCKTADEVACIERSQVMAEIAMEAARAACVPGAHRTDVAGVFLDALRAEGGEHNEIDPIFQVMPRSRTGGPRTSTGHVAFPTGIEDPVFVEGDLVWVDAGHGYEGYVSDYGRTWIVGRDPSPAEQECFDRWLGVMDASYETIRPGVSLGDIGRAATAANRGERPWLPHFYLAHGAGLDSAEMPMIGTDLGQEFDDGFVLAAGMILVLEPIVWVDDVASHRAEEIVVVTDEGCRVLTSEPGYAPYTT